MYLLTFVTIIIGIIGIYGQVLAVQTARIAAQQTGLAGAMLSWHAGAISMAADIIDNQPAAYAAVAAAGCSLSLSPPAGFNRCPHGSSSSTYGTITIGGTGLNLIKNRTTGLFQCVQLQSICSGPSGGSCTSCATQYDVADYQFYSVLYKDSGTGGDYVVTFVPPPTTSASNPAPGFMTLASGNVTGFTQADLLQQLGRSTQTYAYGSVTGGKLKTINNLMPGAQYNVPAAIPNGSLAVVASPDGF